MIALLGGCSRFDLESGGLERPLRPRISDTARLRGTSAKTHNRNSNRENANCILELIFYFFAPFLYSSSCSIESIANVWPLDAICRLY